MAAKNPAVVGYVDIGVAGRSAVTRLSCAAWVENVDPVLIGVIAAVGVSEKSDLRADLFGFVEKPVAGIFHSPLMSVGEENVYAVFGFVYVVFGSKRGKVAVARNVYDLFVQILHSQTVKVAFSVAKKNEQIGVAVALEYLVHSGIVAVSIGKNNNSQNFHLLENKGRISGVHTLE